MQQWYRRWAPSLRRTALVIVGIAILIALCLSGELVWSPLEGAHFSAIRYHPRSSEPAKLPPVPIRDGAPAAQLPLAGHDVSRPQTTIIPVGGFPWGEAYDPENARLFVVDSASNFENVTVIDTVTNQVISTIHLSAGIEYAVYDGDDGIVYVGNCCSQVYAINASSNQVVDTIALGSGCSGGCAPQVEAYDPTNADVYVVDVFTNNVTVVKGDAVVGVVPVGECANGLGYDSVNGNLYSSNECQDNVSIINSSTNRGIGNISSVQPGPAVVADTENGDVFVAGNDGTGHATVTVVSGITNRVLSTVATGNSSGGAAYDPVTGDLYVTQEYNATEYVEGVTVINGTTDRVVGTLPTQQAPVGIAYDDFNHELYVADDNTDNVSLILPSLSIEFHESGLAPGTPWSVSLNNMSLESNDTIVPFSGADGPYSYQVHPVPGYTLSISSGDLQLAGENLTLNVSFTPATYALTFNETGLLNGSRWSVALDGSLGTSVNGTLTFAVESGSFNYTVTPPDGYNATPRNGTVSIQASNKTVDIQFSPLPVQPPPSKPPPTHPGLTSTEWAGVLVLIVAATISVILILICRGRRAPTPNGPPPGPGEPG